MRTPQRPSNGLMSMNDGQMRESSASSRSRKRQTSKRCPLDINHLVKGGVALVQRQLTSHHALLMELTPALPMILGDRVHLQVIINLMNGAEASNRSPIGRGNS